MAGPLSGIQVRPGNLYGTTQSRELAPSGKMGGKEVSQSESPSSSSKLEKSEVPEEGVQTEKPILDRGVEVGGKPTLRTMTEGSDRSSETPPPTRKEVEKRLSELSKKDPGTITRTDATGALKDIADDPVFQKSKTECRNKGFCAMLVKMIKALPGLISGPIYSLFLEQRALRSADRMTNISADAGQHATGPGAEKHGIKDGDVFSLPHELSGAMSGHYRHKAKLKSDEAMVSTMGMMATPVLGPIMTATGTVVGGVLGQTVGTAIEKGGSGVVAGGVKVGARKLGTEPRRRKEAQGQETHQMGGRVKLGYDEAGNRDSGNVVGASRGLLKYLAMAPRMNLLTSPDPQVRQQEESRLLLKRSMGADIATDYTTTERTARDQREKIASNPSQVPLSSGDGMLFSNMGVGSQDMSTDYLRRMMVSENMISHSLESLAVKEQ